MFYVNPLKAELNPICHLLALLGSHHILHVSRIRVKSQSQRPHGLRCGSHSARLLGLRVRIPPAAWMFVSCESCVLSDRGLCDGPITRPEEFYRMWCVWVWSWRFDSEVAQAYWGGGLLEGKLIVASSEFMMGVHVTAWRSSSWKVIGHGNLSLFIIFLSVLFYDAQLVRLYCVRDGRTSEHWALREWY